LWLFPLGLRALQNGIRLAARAALMHRVAILSVAIAISVGEGACAGPRPFSVSEHAVARDLAGHFDEVFSEPGEAPVDVGLLRPRFGAPAVARRGDGFSLAVLDRVGEASVRAALVRFDLGEAAAARCLRLPGDGCAPLRLDEQERAPIEARMTLRTFVASADSPPPAGIYDLVLAASGARIVRARRAAVLSDEDPGAPRTLRVVQLSDLHVGKPGHRAEMQARLNQVIRAVNARAPDLVIVTGDMAEQGHDRGLEEWAAGALLRLDAPVLAVIGNHDYGHFPKLLNPNAPDRGFYEFARVFHALRLTDVTMGGWEFVGVDSGPSIFSPRILTRGMSAETLQRLRQLVEGAATTGRRGVVLFSHAPTRAAIDSSPAHAGSHRVGSLQAGAAGLETLLLDAARRGQRVLHLSGHTHWADLFVSNRAGNDFARVPFSALAEPVRLAAPVALVNAPSATQTSFRVIAHGKASGFVELTLGDRESVLRYASGPRLSGGL